jgi:hypothetical protein
MDEKRQEVGLFEAEEACVDLPPVEQFVAKQLTEENPKGELPTSLCGRGFEIDFEDLIEKQVPQARVRIQKLARRAYDKEILGACGDHDALRVEKSAIALAHLARFLATADRERWYLCFVKDDEGKAKSVTADWHYEGWRFEDRSPTFFSRRHARYYVILPA